jgi:N utilization substance protein A
VAPAATPLEQVPDLGEGVIEKLQGASITTVEALADMTPEQLEAIPGIGPKTIEKISLAVNNYFASLEAGPPVAEGEQAGEPAAPETEVTAAADELPPQQTGSEYAEDVATGQALEADAIGGVENAPAASEETEMHTHADEDAVQASDARQLAEPHIEASEPSEETEAAESKSEATDEEKTQD